MMQRDADLGLSFGRPQEAGEATETQTAEWTLHWSNSLSCKFAEGFLVEAAFRNFRFLL